jgi:hypothetical protein
MAAVKEERSVTTEEENGDIEDVPPPPLLGRNGGSEDEAETEEEAGSLKSQRWPRSFRCVGVHSLLNLVSFHHLCNTYERSRFEND